MALVELLEKSFVICRKSTKVFSCIVLSFTPAKLPSYAHMCWHTFAACKNDTLLSA